VGRAAEMSALREMVNDLQQGVGRIVGILGEAGLGKTRLVAETARVFRATCGTNLAWYEVGSLSYETNQAYGLFQRLIRRVQGIDDNDPSPVVREKLGQLAAGLPADQRERALPVFEALFGFKSEAGAALEGEAFRRALRAATEAWWRACASCCR